jgi:hypothetical protein
VFACERLCRAAESGGLDDGAREAMNCTLAASPIPESRWRSAELIPIHMGLPTRWDRDGRDVDFMRPLEDIAGEGCPGGWYRCGFVRSLHKFRRRGEARTENLLLSRSTDRLVLEAVAYLEDEEAHALGAFYEARDADG